MAGPADPRSPSLKTTGHHWKGTLPKVWTISCFTRSIRSSDQCFWRVEFVQSGTNVPYVQISTIDYLKIYTVSIKPLLQAAERVSHADPRVEWCSPGGSEYHDRILSAGTRPMTGTVSVNGANLPQLHSLRRDLPGRIISWIMTTCTRKNGGRLYVFKHCLLGWFDTSGKVTFKNVGDRNAVIIRRPQDQVALFTKRKYGWRAGGESR